MRTWFLRARESFWFLPTVFGVAAIALAIGLTELDRLLLANGDTSGALLADLSATGGRAILTVIGGTMLGVAATSFSITISVLATTSSAYGPRLVRNFMADRGNQFVLAVLTSTFLYTLVVLRAVRTEQDSISAFVPVTAVTFAVFLAIADVAVLVYFIHHIARSVQVTTLQGRVLRELVEVIDLLYPDASDRDTVATEPDDLIVHEEFFATASGYVQYVDFEDLVAFARAHQVVVRIATPPGTHVLEGQVIAQSLVSRNQGRDESTEKAASKAITSAIAVGAARTPHQDLGFAVQGLTEIGVRGLAAGTNDPYTAVAAIDALSSALVTLCGRPAADGRYPGDDGELRVVCRWPSPIELIADALLALRTYGMNHPLVVRAGVGLLERLEAAMTGGDRLRLRDEIAAFRSAYVATDPPPTDAAPVLERLDDTVRRLP
ncbi:DUF2254 domain-containing protein [Microbacterium aurugineum]